MSTAGSYTAKLLDGPLEGRTFATEFLDSGDPRAQLAIPVEAGKRYLYSRTGGVEYDEPDGRPTAVEYRFAGTDFD